MDIPVSLATIDPLQQLALAIATIVLLVLLKKYFNGGLFKYNTVELNGKYAVVTGGNSGIGA